MMGFDGIDTLFSIFPRDGAIPQKEHVAHSIGLNNSDLIMTYHHYLW